MCDLWLVLLFSLSLAICISAVVLFRRCDFCFFGENLLSRHLIPKCKTKNKLTKQIIKMCLTPHERARISTKFMLKSFFLFFSFLIIFLYYVLFFILCRFFSVCVCVFICVPVRVPLTHLLAPRSFVDRCYHFENSKLIFPFDFSLFPFCFAVSFSFIGDFYVDNQCILTQHAAYAQVNERARTLFDSRAVASFICLSDFHFEIVLSFDMNWNGLAIHFIDLIVCRLGLPPPSSPCPPLCRFCCPVRSRQRCHRHRNPCLSSLFTRFWYVRRCFWIFHSHHLNKLLAAFFYICVYILYMRLFYLILLFFKI